MNKTLPYTGARKRGVLIVALIVASSTELLAQGTSPWLQAIDVLQAGVHRPDSARLESDCHRGRRLDVCLW